MYPSKCFTFISLFLCLAFLGLSADYATNSTYLDLTSTISDLSHDCDYAPLSKDCELIKKSKNLRPLAFFSSSETFQVIHLAQTSSMFFNVPWSLTAMIINHPSRAPPASL